MIVALRVVGREVPGVRDVVLRAGNDHSVADLCDALAGHLDVAVPGLTLQRTARSLPAALAVTACGLVSGDLLMIATDACGVLDVVSGADIGKSYAIASARCLIGRGAGVDVALADVSVSRRHAELEVATTGITVTPIAPVHVNGASIEFPTPIRSGDALTIGGSQLVVREHAASSTVASARPTGDGTVEFRRTPYRPPLIADRGTVTIGPIPERHDPRRLQLLSIAGPLLAGLVLFAFMRRIEFLALTLLSPVLLVASALDDRRAGRRSGRRQIEAFRSMLSDRTRELESLRAAERAQRLAAAPAIEDLRRRAVETTIDLWPRGNDTDDLLRLRIGIGTAPARFGVALAAGGEPRLRDEAAAAVDGATNVAGAPITVDLAGEVLAIQGNAALGDGVLRSLVLQAACLHPPDAVSIVVAVGPDRDDLEWIKWLPHARRAKVARTRAEAELLVRALIHDVRRRADVEPDVEPHVLAVIDADLAGRSASLAQLLDLVPQAGLSIVWLASVAADVHHKTSVTLELGAASRLSVTSSAAPPIDVAVEQATRGDADRIAMALAPLRADAHLVSGLGSNVGLLDVLGHGATSSATVMRWWQRSGRCELRVPIGVGATGPVVVDLVEDGPHMLIAGTTGSGKSELLQSTVTAIAARYSPQRVNLLFVDYKGGAATNAFRQLPHTVGYVTDLDPAIARRAIVSLRAELERRMSILHGRAKDMRDLQALAPDATPPALVIVIDEFATLAKQLPEFVAGVVDIAQRGRSLGIHLVLSTQRLAGAVDDSIVANTNVRLALRVLDRGDSTAMVGSGDAADIPVVRRGRGVGRIGTHRPFVFQSAYGPTHMADDRAAPRTIEVVDFADATQLVESQAIGDVPGGRDRSTQQQVVLAAVAAAAARLASAPLHRPWCEPLPEVVTLDDVPLTGEVRSPAIGVFDAPESQLQGPLVLDLERGGPCAIFGSGGAGKTTALRSVALALTRAASDRDPVVILALDGRSRGLGMLRALPTVVDVAAGDDLEAITRHIDALDRELGRRRRVLSEATAEDLSALHADDPPMPRVVVLIDDIGNLIDALGEHGGGMLSTGESWSERLVRIVVEGRQVGIHGVVTADRLGGVPSRLLAATSNRIVLGCADRAAYVDHGVPADAPVLQDLPPGRGWWNGGTVVQLAVAALDHSARGQQAAIATAAASCRAGSSTVLRSEALPARAQLARRASSSPPLTVAIGIEDITGAAVWLDLTGSHVAVVGHPRSGRSTALRTIASGLAGSHELFAVGPPSSGLAAAPIRHAAFGRPDEIAPILERLFSLASAGVGSPALPAVLLVDDLELLDDITLVHLWDRLATMPHIRIVAGANTAALTGFTSNPVASVLKRSRQMFVMGPADSGHVLQLTGMRFVPRPGLHWVPGRGVLFADRVPRVVQVALPDEQAYRTPVRSRGRVSGVTVMTTQSLPTAAVATPASR